MTATEYRLRISCGCGAEMELSGESGAWNSKVHRDLWERMHAAHGLRVVTQGDAVHIVSAGIDPDDVEGVA